MIEQDEINKTFECAMGQIDKVQRSFDLQSSAQDSEGSKTSKSLNVKEPKNTMNTHKSHQN